MSEPLRTFIAVPLPESVRDSAAEALADARVALGERARWTPAENLHLTLKFLGDVDRDQLPKLIQRLQAKLAGVAVFEAALGGLGAFPNAREASVLWLGVTTGLSDLAKLARKVDAASKVVGVAREKRPFRAHLTLARLRTPERVDVERMKAPEEVPFRVEQVILYESRLSPDGARHVPLAHLPLGVDDEDRAIDFAPEM
ncbi:MAG: RNA 2',3'-cyclic phosphodiesterase [bacterium]|nr:RNA 2',3'-cyclic phosphodiesterase [bacterium]